MDASVSVVESADEVADDRQLLLGVYGGGGVAEIVQRQCRTGQAPVCIDPMREGGFDYMSSLRG